MATPPGDEKAIKRSEMQEKVTTRPAQKWPEMTRMSKLLQRIVKAAKLEHEPVSAGQPIEEPFSNRTSAIILVAIASLTALFLYPNIFTPLLQDDSQNIYFAGIMGYENWSAWEWLQTYNSQIVASGRFFPGMTLIQTIKFLSTQSSVAFHALNIVAITINIVTFYFLVLQFASRRVALLSSVVAITTLQARAFYESISQITIENQVIWELLLLTTLSAFLFANRPNNGRLFLLLALYFLSDATYEISFLFIVIYAVIIAFHGTADALKRSTIGMSAIFVFFIALNLVIRSKVHIPSSSEYAISLDPLRYITTLYYQVVSAFPMTYILANPYNVLPDRLNVLFGTVRIAAIVGIASFILTLAILMYKRFEPTAARRVENVKWLTAWFLSVAFMVVPALLTSLSHRWQDEVHLGLPYQPAYLSGFGCALLISLLIERVLRRNKRDRIKIALAASSFVGVALFSTYQVNANIYTRSFSNWKYPFRTFSHSLERGGLGAIPDGSVVLYETTYVPSWPDPKYRFFLFTHRRLNVQAINQQLNAQSFCSVPIRFQICSSAIPNLFYYTFESHTVNFGRSELLWVKSFDISDLSTNHLEVRSSRGLIYEEFPSIAVSNQLPLSNKAVVWEPLINRDDYFLASFTPKCGTVSAEGIIGRDVSFDFGQGAYVEEVGNGGAFHWAGPKAEIELVNNTEAFQATTATLNFETYDQGIHHITIQEANGRETTLPLHIGATTFTYSARLAPNGKNKLRLSTDAPRVPSGADFRDLRMRIFGYTVQATAGACRPSSANVGSR